MPLNKILDNDTNYRHATRVVVRIRIRIYPVGSSEFWPARSVLEQRIHKTIFILEHNIKTRVNKFKTNHFFIDGLLLVKTYLIYIFFSSLQIKFGSEFFQ